jgi:hypothetical protein
MEFEKVFYLVRRVSVNLLHESPARDAEQIAEALNAKDAAEMRSGFTCKLMNMRGVHGFSAGKEEREIAAGYRKKAEELEQRGYSRFATAMRELAEHYERDAKREAARDPYGD